MMNLQREAADASVDFCVAHGEDPLTSDDAFVAGYLAGAESRDQRISHLERLLERVTQGVLKSHRLEDTYRSRGL